MLQLLQGLLSHPLPLRHRHLLSTLLQLLQLCHQTVQLILQVLSERCCLTPATSCACHATTQLEISGIGDTYSDTNKYRPSVCVLGAYSLLCCSCYNGATRGTWNVSPYRMCPLIECVPIYGTIQVSSNCYIRCPTDQSESL